jgi:hypothetical protein
MLKTLKPSTFGMSIETDSMSANNKEFEDIVYEFGHVMYRLGRMETDGLDSTNKEYNKVDKRKEELRKIIAEFFKTSK